jgi:hypothetical protein
MTPWIDLVRRPALDSVWRQILETHIAEMRQDVVAEDRVVVAQRRRLPLAILLDVAEVLATGVRDGHARANHARQGAGGSRSQSRP